MANVIDITPHTNVIVNDVSVLNTPLEVLHQNNQNILQAVEDLKVKLNRVSLSGPSSIYSDVDNNYLITNYNSQSTYDFSIEDGLGNSVGTVTDNGGGNFTVNVDLATGLGNVVLIITRDQIYQNSFNLTLSEPYIVTRYATYPSGSGVYKYFNINYGGFSSVPSGYATYYRTYIEISTTSDFSSGIVFSTNTTNQTSYEFRSDVLNPSTTYYIRIRHRGYRPDNTLFYADWGTIRSFTTEASFYNYPSASILWSSSVYDSQSQSPLHAVKSDGRGYSMDSGGSNLYYRGDLDTPTFNSIPSSTATTAPSYPNQYGGFCVIGSYMYKVSTSVSSWNGSGNKTIYIYRSTVGSSSYTTYSFTYTKTQSNSYYVYPVIQPSGDGTTMTITFKEAGSISADLYYKSVKVLISNPGSVQAVSNFYYNSSWASTYNQSNDYGEVFDGTYLLIMRRGSSAKSLFTVDIWASSPSLKHSLNLSSLSIDSTTSWIPNSTCWYKDHVYLSCRGSTTSRYLLVKLANQSGIES